MEIYRLHFGRRLGEAIARSGLNQRELADLLEVEPSNITRWKKGEVLPEDHRLPGLCKALRVDVSYFVPEANIPQDAVRLLDIFRRLTAKGRLVAISQLESLLAFHEEKSRAAR